jgi:hypothetical protein
MLDRINQPALWVLAFALCVLTCCVRAEAAQTRTFTITKPVGYVDGTAFGTEQLVYVVYNAADDKQLFSTQSLVTTRTDVPDGATCFYVRAGIYNFTSNSILAGTLSDPSPNSCPTNPPAKKVGLAGLLVQ